MRDVTVPDPVIVKNPVTGEPIQIDGDKEPWTMFRYLATCVVPDPGLGKGYKADRMRCELEDLFREATPGSIVGIEEAPWEKLCKVLEAPSGDLPRALTQACLPFAEAIVGAPKRPKE